jgi:hypothetical protein
MGRALWIAALVASVGACAAPPQITDRSEFLAEATRTYQGETTERMILAAQSVLEQSDPKYFEFRNTLNGFSGLRRYYVYAVIAAQNGRERWDFTADRGPNGAVRAGLTIADVGASQSGYNRTAYDVQMASIPMYRLFWSRVDYVLGRSENWTTCEDAEVQFHDTKISPLVALGGLCGPTSHGRDGEPPERLAPLPKPSNAPTVTAPKRKLQTQAPAEKPG